MQIDDLANARRCREQARRDKAQTDRYYAEQAHILAQWEWGKRPPAGLVLGELPYVSPKQIRLDRD